MASSGSWRVSLIARRPSDCRGQGHIQKRRRAKNKFLVIKGPIMFTDVFMASLPEQWSYTFTYVWTELGHKNCAQTLV